MPNKKQTSRKNTVATKPKAEVVTTEDDWAVNITVKSAPNSRASTRSKKPEPVPEPPRVVPDWERVGMTQEEYEGMMERVAKAAHEYQVQRYRESLLADLDSISYWENRIESLERSRERFNRKAGWSAEAIRSVEEIDKEIEFCEQNIDRIEAMDGFDSE